MNSTRTRNHITDRTRPIAKAIAAARIASGLPQREFAAKIGITHRTIQRYEAGQAEPKASDLPALAKALGVEIAQLLGVAGRSQKRTTGA